MRKTVWLLTGNGSYAMFQLLNMIVISKSLGLESLGAFSMALAIAAPIMLFANLGMRVLWVTNSLESVTFNDLRLIRLLFSILGAAMTCLVIMSLFDNDKFLPIYLIVTCSKLVENNADIFYAKYHRDGLHKKIAISLFSRSVLGFLGMSFGCFVFGSLLHGTIFYLLMWLCSHIVTEQLKYQFSDNENQNLDKYKIVCADVITKGAPIAIGLLLANLNVNIPRIFLEDQFDLSVVGLYSALYFFIQTGSLVIVSFGQVILPELSSLYNANKLKEHYALVLRALGLIVLLGLASSIASYFLGEKALKILFDDTVASHSSLLSLFLLISPAQYSVSIINIVLASVKRNSIIMWCQLMLLISLVVLSSFLIPRYEILGAFLSYSIACLFISTIYILQYRKVLRDVK